MSKIKNILKKRPSQLFLITVTFLFSFLFAPLARANVADFVTDILGWIALRLVELFGVVFVWLVGILIDIAQFNHFIDLPMVETGWGLTRDLANMFFIVILLIIAFSTILKIQSYHYQKTFMKLLIMAVLINFSKLIAGFLIDFFQVIMLTFVNGFKDVAAGNIAQGFGIYDMLSSASSGDVGTITSTTSERALGALLAVVLIIVADMTVLIMIAVLLWRIAMLWLLVIVSPLAYLSYSIVPKYWSQWWSEFFKNLISGPIIAFFLWLALLTVQSGGLEGKFVTDSGKDTVKKDYSFLGSAFDNKTFMNYLVMLALLMGGLAVTQKVAQQSGGAVGAFASKVQKYGTRVGMIATGAAAVGYGLRKGREKTVDSLRGLATTSPVREGLGYLASRRGIIGKTLAFTGIRRLATVGLAKAEVEKKKREEKQRDFYGQIKDTRVRERVANSRFNTAARRVVRDSSPSLIRDNNIAQQVVNDLSQDKINKLSDAELTSLGRRAGAGDIDLTGTRLGNHLARNTNDRSLFNLGVEQAQVEEMIRHNSGLSEVVARDRVRANNINMLRAEEQIPGMVVAQDRNGRDLRLEDFDGNAEDFYRGAYGPPRVGPFDYDRVLRRNQFDNMYRLADADDMTKGRGDGNLSVNRFGDRHSNALAIDFDKLDKGKLDFLKDFDEVAKVKGVTLDTPEKITKAAVQLAAILDDEVNKLRASGGNERDIQNLEQARDRLKRPEELSNLQLLNSSAHGYSNSDLKKTYIEEQIHGFGVKSEKDAKSLTQQVIDNRLYSSLEKLATAVAGGKKVEEVIAAELADTSSGQAPPSSAAKVKTELKPEEVTIEPEVEEPKREIEVPAAPTSTSTSADEKTKPKEAPKTIGPAGTIKDQKEGISREAMLLGQIRNELRKKK